MAVIALIIGCQPGSKPKPIDYRETPKPTHTDFCGVAERNLSSLCNADPQKNLYCCQTVAPTKKGKSFTQFCYETQNAGIELNPMCLAGVNSCDEIDKCVGTTR